MSLANTDHYAPGIGRSDAPAFGATMSSLSAMCWPIMLGALAMALLNIGQISLLGNHVDQGPLYIMSLMQPAYLLFFAFLEAVSITAQVYSARSRNNWPAGNVMPMAILLTLIGAVLGVVVVGAIYLATQTFAFNIPLLSPDMLAALPGYVLSLLPLLAFEVFNGALRGQGKPLHGFVILSLSVVLNIGLVYKFLILDGLGIEAIFYANAISGTLAFLLMFAASSAHFRGMEKGPLVQALMRTGTLLAVVGVPVLASLLIAMVSSGVLFNELATFGHEYAAGFLIVFRTRFFFLIPAIALATSIAILVNQQAGEKDAAYRKAMLSQGIVAIVGFYALATAALYLAIGPITRMMASDPAVQDAARLVFIYLVPTFLVIGVAVAFQIILENLDRGVRVMIWTLVLEAGTVGVLITYTESVMSAIYIMLGAVVAYAAAFSFEYVALMRSPKAFAAADRVED
jgi:Na+-driven multidrug efflux pump